MPSLTSWYRRLFTREPRRFYWNKGRRYLVAIPYPLPKDMGEVHRLDRQHFVLRYDLRGNYLAPISEPRTILDIGCGTGRWAMEIAAQFPHAQVTGIDVVLPDEMASLGHGLEQRPPNVSFLEGNILQGLPFADESFDFVHMRLLYTAIPAASWPLVLDDIMRIMRPGAWFESIESLPLLKGTNRGIATIVEWFNDLLRGRGVDPLIALKLPELLQAKGLVQVTSTEVLQVRRSPTNTWSKEARRTSGLAMVDDLKGPIIAQGIASEEEYERVAALARDELQADRMKTGMNLYATLGQRPMSSGALPLQENAQD